MQTPIHEQLVHLALDLGAAATRHDADRRLTRPLRAAAQLLHDCGDVLAYQRRGGSGVHGPDEGERARLVTSACELIVAALHPVGRHGSEGLAVVTAAEAGMWAVEAGRRALDGGGPAVAPAVGESRRRLEVLDGLVAETVDAAGAAEVVGR